MSTATYSAFNRGDVGSNPAAPITKSIRSMRPGRTADSYKVGVLGSTPRWSIMTDHQSSLRMRLIAAITSAIAQWRSGAMNDAQYAALFQSIMLFAEPVIDEEKKDKAIESLIDAGFSLFAPFGELLDELSQDEEFQKQVEHWSTVQHIMSETDFDAVTLDELFDNIDKMMLAGDFHTLDMLMEGTDVSKCNETYLLGMLSMTKVAKSKLAKRSDFFLRVKEELSKRGLTPKTLDGLN